MHWKTLPSSPGSCTGCAGRHIQTDEEGHQEQVAAALPHHQLPVDALSSRHRPQPQEVPIDCTAEEVAQGLQVSKLLHPPALQLYLVGGLVFVANPSAVQNWLLMICFLAAPLDGCTRLNRGCPGYQGHVITANIANHRWWHVMLCVRLV